MKTAKNVFLILTAALIFIAHVSGLKTPVSWEYRPESKINDISVSDTGIAAVALQDSTILLLDKEKTERRIALDVPAKTVGISTDGKTFFVVVADVLTKYDSAGTIIWSRKLENTINKISLSDSNIAVAANCNKKNVINECNTTYLFDKEGSLVWAQLKGWGAVDIDISPEGGYLVVIYEVKKSFLFNKNADTLFEIKSTVATDGQMFDVAVFSGGNIAAGFQEGLRALNNFKDSEPRASWFYRTDSKVVGVDSVGTGEYTSAIARRFEQIDYKTERGYDFRGCCAIYLVEAKALWAGSSSSIIG